MNGGHRHRNGTTLCLLTNPAFACNITMAVFKFGDTVMRGCCVMLSYTRYHSLGGGGIGFHCHTPLVRIADTPNSMRYSSEVLEPVVHPYIQRVPLAIFQQDNA
ncbi:hypothetical protein TNCV_3229611 [Trichonephila clavipes]|nr:hypothetical protein TNCV_3229611 [Trichonephila clavipes]